MNQPYIVSWGHTPFGKLDNIDLEQLIRDAALPAIESAGLEPSDIDGIFVGHFGAGFVPQDFSAALLGVAIPEFRHTPAVRMEMPAQLGRPLSGLRWMHWLAVGSSVHWWSAWKK